MVNAGRRRVETDFTDQSMGFLECLGQPQRQGLQGCFVETWQVIVLRQQAVDLLQRSALVLAQAPPEQVAAADAVSVAPLGQQRLARVRAVHPRHCRPQLRFEGQAAARVAAVVIIQRIQQGRSN